MANWLVVYWETLSSGVNRFELEDTPGNRDAACKWVQASAWGAVYRRIALPVV